MIKLNRKSKKLLLLQRNELLTETQKWLRKKFGRFLFTNLLINYFQNKNTRGHGFSKFYEKQLAIVKNKPLNILEIGSYAGASAAAFSKYFYKSKIAHSSKISHLESYQKKLWDYSEEIVQDFI